MEWGREGRGMGKHGFVEEQMSGVVKHQMQWNLGKYKAKSRVRITLIHRAIHKAKDTCTDYIVQVPKFINGILRPKRKQVHPERARKS